MEPSVGPFCFILLAVLHAGFMIYFVGLIFLAHHQKNRTAKMVRAFMQDHSTVTKTWKWMGNAASGYRRVTAEERAMITPLVVTVDFPTFPDRLGAQFQEHADKHFIDLDLSESKACDAMRQGITEWGLDHLWNMIERRNVWYSLKVCHGLPLFRQYYQCCASEPVPRGLHGVLLANKLHVLTSGCCRLVAGVVLLTEKRDLRILIPVLLTVVGFAIVMVDAMWNCSEMLRSTVQKEANKWREKEDHCHKQEKNFHRVEEGSTVQKNANEDRQQGLPGSPGPRNQDRGI